MQQGSSRTLTIIVLGVITIALVGVAIFVGLRLQETQAPEDTSAAGYGEEATDYLYTDVEDLFATIPCETFMNLGLAVSLSQATANPLSATWESVSGEEPATLIPKDCTYTLSDSGTIHLLAHTYGVGSYVYDSETEKHEIVNGNVISRVMDEAIISDGYIEYYFGESKIDADECVATVFHVQNEFDYIILTYSGFSSCEAAMELNVHLMSSLGSMITHQIQSVTEANGFIYDRDGNRLISISEQ